MAADSIARWDGTQWTPLGAGIVANASVGLGLAKDMEVFESPTCELLVVTGVIDLAGGQPVSGIVAWDGTSWSSLGSGLANSVSFPAGVQLVAADVDGQGERLYVYGRFDSAGGFPALRGAVWDGTSWAATAASSAGAPFDSIVFDDGSGRAVYHAGGGALFGGVPSSGIARVSDPCGMALGYPRCTSTVNSTGAAGLLRASGSASISADDVLFTADRLPASSLTLLVNGTEELRGVAGDGFLCVGGTLRRMYPAGVTNASGRVDTRLDFNSVYAGGIASGTSRVFQAFFRDLAGGPAGFNTTDALQIVFRP